MLVIKTIDYGARGEDIVSASVTINLRDARLANMRLIDVIAAEIERLGVDLADTKTKKRNEMSEPMDMPGAVEAALVDALYELEECRAINAELLAALDRIVEFEEAAALTDALHHAVLMTARAAIAKAEGEAL